MHLATWESIAVIIGVAIAGIGFILGLATLFGNSMKTARNAKIVADYEAGYKGLEAKSRGQEEQIEELQRQGTVKDNRILELEHELATLNGKMAILQEVVTGKSAIEELTKQLAGLADAMNHRADVMGNRIGETLNLVGQLRTEVREAHSQILTAVTPGEG